MAETGGLSLRWRLTLTHAALTVAAGLICLVLALAASGVLDARARDHLRALFPEAAIGGLACLAAVGLAGGWVLAGWTLRPLDAVRETVAQVSAGSLTSRLGAPGSAGELREMTEAFNQMLDRVQRSFDEQRRFTQNASHELRTPLTVSRAMLEVALSDPVLTGANRVVLRRLEEMNLRSIRTLEALFTLARLDRGGFEQHPCDLADLVEMTLDDLDESGAGNLDLQVDLRVAELVANEGLVRQLVDNLLRNAVVHNTALGSVRVRTGTDRSGRGVLEVQNTGEDLTPAQVATFTEPFVRGRQRLESSAWASGSGLGLALVASVARAHRADLMIRPREGGGLVVRVRFPAPSASGQVASTPTG